MQRKQKASAKILSYLVFPALLLLTAGLAACGSSGEKAGGDQAEAATEGKISVTVTTGMIKDLVENVGGKHVNVTALMGTGVDPHLYKASHGDIEKLDQADMVFYNGLHLEGKMNDILKQIGKQKPAIAVAENIEPSRLRAGDPDMGEYDPHIWFDVKLWMIAAETVRDAFIEYDPGHQEDYEKNAGRYLNELKELDKEVTGQIASIPKQSRVLVTAHDAFGYFGDAYDIKVMGLQGLSTASEAGTKDVIDLRDYLVENKIKAVFIESSVPRKAIDAVIEGAAEKGHQIEIGGELFSDAMGEVGTPEGTYIGMIRHNVETIVHALK